MNEMSDEQYKKFIDDISEAVVKLMITKQAEYDAQFKLELEKQYGYEVEFTTDENDSMSPEQELELLKVALQQALNEERYEDIGAIEEAISKIKNNNNL
jgi:hypothetical protein